MTDQARLDKTNFIQSNGHTAKRRLPYAAFVWKELLFTRVIQIGETLPLPISYIQNLPKSPIAQGAYGCETGMSHSAALAFCATRQVNKCTKPKERKFQPRGSKNKQQRNIPPHMLKIKLSFLPPGPPSLPRIHGALRAPQFTTRMELT